MKESGRLKCLSAIFSACVVTVLSSIWCTVSCNKDGSNAAPDTPLAPSFAFPVYAVKWDPFIATETGFTADTQAAFWKGKGLNSVFAIVHFRDGRVLFPPDADAASNFHHSYPATLLQSADAMADMAAALGKYSLSFYAGSWMFRDDPVYADHPEWRQIDATGSNEPENLLCPNSPYLEKEFYPFYSCLLSTYGVRGIFLQEMWFGFDGLRPVRSCYCSNCLGLFSTAEGQIMDRIQVLANMQSDPAFAVRWDAFHYRTLKNIVLKLESMAGSGSRIIWHNPVMNWNDISADAQFKNGRTFSDMSLYPDEMIFASRDPNTVDPYLEYAHVRNFMNIFAGNPVFLEYLSFKGMPGLTRDVEAADVIGLHLAARAAGMGGFLAEQDAFLDQLEVQKPGVWQAVETCLASYEPLFQGALYQGVLTSDVAVLSNVSLYGGWWKNGDVKLVIIGNRLDAAAASYVLQGTNCLDGAGNAVSSDGVLAPGDVRIFQMH